MKNPEPIEPTSPPRRARPVPTGEITPLEIVFDSEEDRLLWEARLIVLMANDNTGPEED